jgi:2-polyprenyl-3-methyl-5-hydroxy-6-metoxy-1,4-benzoquinol methylase
MEKKCTFCGSTSLKLCETINQKPHRETNFNIPEDKYLRYIYQCQQCSIYFAIHDYDFSLLYEGSYNSSTYANKIEQTYNKIMSLDPASSDNVQRCKRIDLELKSRSFTPFKTKVLDVGSGLCVFLGKLKEYGYLSYAVDPDQHSIQHALDYVKISGAHCGKVADLPKDLVFQAVTFNKVLEHVIDPLTLLQQSLKNLESGGCCYIELPDGDEAQRNGGFIEQEEFFIEHYFAFTIDSMKKLMTDAQLTDIKIESIFEPSGKYTLYGFGTKV